MSRTKKIAVLAIIAMVLTLMPAALFAATATDTRIAGTDRVGTSIEIASAGWTTAGTVILAPADQANLVDALAAAPLAGQENAPILLTFKGSLDAAVKAKIAALGATKVYVVGAISDAVAAEVDAMTGVAVEALKGNGRQATAAAVNAKLTSPAGTFVVGYDAIPDALSVASFAAKNKYAIMLANADGTFSGTAVGSTKYIVGGTAKVADISGLTRISGADRFATNKAVADTLTFTYDRVYVANGVSLVDALAVAPLAAKYSAFVALASGSDVAASATVNSKLTSASKVIAVGGTSAVSDTVKGKVAYNNGTVTVESVSVLNAKQVQVVFNQAVTGLEKSNFTVTQTADAAGVDRLTDSVTATNGVAGATVGTGAIVMSADNKTATLTIDNGAKFTNGKTISVLVKTVTNLTDITKTAVLSDTVVPSITKAESVGSKKIKITFNEPVYNGATDDTTTSILAAGNVVINNGAVAVASVVGGTRGSNALIVTTAADLAVGTEYTIKLNTTGAGTDLKDFAGYLVMANATSTFTHTAVTTVPTVTAEAKSEYKVRLTFDKPVTIDATGNIEFRYGYNASTAVKVTSAGGVPAAVAGKDNQFDVTFASPLNQGAGTMYIYYKVAADAAKTNVIVDGYGNVVPTGTAVTFSVATDVTAPTATVAYKDATHMDVTFSEAVTGHDTLSNYVVKDKDGKVVAVTGFAVVDANTYKYRLTVASMAVGGNYTVTISSNIKDTSAALNKFVSTTFTITAPDTTRPTLTNMANNAVVANADKIYIYFSENMSTTATDLNNYRLANAGGTQYTLPTGTTITLNGSTATISLTKTLAGIATDLGSGALTQIYVGAVTDLAGNNPATMANSAINVMAANFAPGVATVKKLADNQVSFTVTRHLKSADATKITKTAGGTQATLATYTNNSDGTATVTCTFPAATFTTTAADQISLALDALTDLNDFTSAASGANNITLDYAAPTFAAATPYVTNDNDKDGQIDQIIVTYSEALYAASVSESDYTVEGYTINGVTVGGATVIIAVAEKGSADTNVTPKLTQVGTVQDDITLTATQTARNEMAAQTEKTVADGAAPVLLTATITAGATAGFGNDAADQLTLTFSEPVYAPAAGWTDAAPTFAQLAAAFTFSGGQPGDGTFTSGSIDTTAEASATIVLTSDGALTNVVSAANTITGKAATIKDAANNTQVVGTAVTVN
ncbi:cell wall-binding repeat-containing protein [Dehalobacter sp. TeCB1]|uniref:cell wall-binding repeat-containing protein n=1 Tax=Dehalobacter sp. TeCB1 TaxID=1843715 RepID=UPI000839F9BE|nr:cell wall-binding repeat-containing protein [Dehalobacter sp. TeCB1]OCZ49690.1 hypothetical protein A7D23_02335 [Dehalobacter sp. TeCB1]